MGNVFDLVRLLALAAAATLLIRKRRAIADAIERGGPGTPMHPTPAGDDAHLRARSGREE